MTLAYGEPYKDIVFSPFLPTLICIIIGYILGDMFSSVYGMALDTIVICSILDTEIMKRANMDAYF